MNRHTVLADIAGRPTRTVIGSHRVTAAGVVLATSECDAIRASLPAGLSKWRDSTFSDASAVVDLLCQRALAIAGISVTREAASWDAFLSDEGVFHPKMASLGGDPAGWAKAPVLLTLELLLRACTTANAHAVRIGPRDRILDIHGLQLIECNVVCDTEISGAETIEIFRSFWEQERIPNQKLASLGYRITHPRVELTTEQDEPLLLLADYVAGITHAALLPSPGRIRLPLTHADSAMLLARMQSAGNLFVEDMPFTTSYSRIFGDAFRDATSSPAS